jgi:hypothetical protein
VITGADPGSSTAGSCTRWGEYAGRWDGGDRLREAEGA